MNSWFPLEWILKSNIFNIKNISMTYHILSRYINARLMRKIQTVNPKGNQSWIFIGRTNAEAETPILCPPDAKNWHVRKDPDAGKDWGGRRRGWQKMRWLDGITNSIGMRLSQLFASGGQSIGVSASTSVLPMNTQDGSPSEWTGWISLQSKGLSRVFSNTTVQNHQFFSAQLSL